MTEVIFQWSVQSQKKKPKQGNDMISLPNNTYSSQLRSNYTRIQQADVSWAKTKSKGKLIYVVKVNMKFISLGKKKKDGEEDEEEDDDDLLRSAAPLTCTFIIYFDFCFSFSLCPFILFHSSSFILPLSLVLFHSSSFTRPLSLVLFHSSSFILPLSLINLQILHIPTLLPSLSLTSSTPSHLPQLSPQKRSRPPLSKPIRYTSST
jgi:hypothetical protein